MSMHLGNFHAPRAWFLVHSHALGTYGMHPVHVKSAGRKLLFLLFVGKARTFSPNPGRNSQYKYQPS